MVDHTSPTTADVLMAFFMGFRFDLVVSSYILFIPAFLLLVPELIGIQAKGLRKGLFYFICTLFSVAFVVGAIDIPYFNEFNERFSIGAFRWIETPWFLISMIINEPSYIVWSIPMVIALYGFYRGFRYIHRRTLNYHQPFNKLIALGLSLVLLLVMFLGVRGRYQNMSPIRVGTAYFSSNSFLNKMGLNPTFTFLKSYLNSTNKKYAKVRLMDGKDALHQAQDLLSVTDTTLATPLSRQIIGDSNAIKPNIVVVMMERMSAYNMEYFGNQNNMTPFLDSMAHESLFFDHFYTAGIHTFNGVFSTLYSYPALYRQHTMKILRSYDGIAHALKAKGYSTTYFTPHDSQHDNIEGFLRNNDFDEIISEANYPSAEVKTNMGVPDDYLFRYAIPHLNNLAASGKPFFSAFMTGSNHGPYYVPEYFQSDRTDPKEQVVQYADWSLRRFLNLAKQQAWFENTLFVFLADHGFRLAPVYDVPLNYFHSPLIFYMPSRILPKKEHKMASQVDVFPTIMGLIGQDYVNSTLGINLLKESRPYAIMNANSLVGIIDSTDLCLMKDNGDKIEFYHHLEGDKTDLYQQNKDKADAMAEYAKVMMQTHQYLIETQQTYSK